MALPSTGIRISAVRNTLGENTNDLGSLCTSPRINENSFWKPVTSPVLTMTEAELFRVNDGFSITSYNSPISLWNAINNNETWRYDPTQNEAPYRLGDFRTYDQYANKWFNWEFQNTAQAYKNENRPIENLGSQNLQWVWGNFQAFTWLRNSLQDTACLGLLMSPRKTGNDNSVYFYRICSTLDYDSERLNFTVPDSLNSYDQTYYFTPVLSTVMNTADGSVTYYTEANPPQVTGQWWPLKGNVFSLYLKNEGYTPPAAFTMTVDIPWVSFDYSNFEITNLEGQFVFTISSARTYPVNVSAEVKYMNASQPHIVAGLGGTIPAGSTTLTQSWSYKNTIYVAADLKDESELPFTIEWSYSYLGNTFRGTTSVSAPRQY